MITEVLNMLADMFQQILALFFRVIDGLGARDIVFGALVVTTIYRILLAPLIGGQAISRSDKVSDGNYYDNSGVDWREHMNYLEDKNG